MSEWKEYRLGDVCEISSSKRIFAQEYTIEGIPFFRGKEIIEKQRGTSVSTELYISHKRYNEIKNKFGVPQKGDMLLTSVGTLGIPYVVKDEQFYFKDGNLTWFRNFNDIVVDFLYYWILSKYGRPQIESRAIGTTQRALTIENLRKFEINLPPLDEQRRIASILSSLDDKIAVNRRICENLEAQAQALFKHWFIDFAPFKDGKFVESELGMIPEGWRVGTLGEHVDNLGGYSYKGSELQPSSVAMATIKNFIRGGGFKIEGYKEIIISKNIKDYQYIQLFDVLVAHTDLTQNAEVVGNPAIILSTAGYDKLIMSMDLTKVIPKDKRLTTPLLHLILSTKKFKEHALGYVNGTTVLHMNKKAVPEYKLAMPNNLDVLEDLSSFMDSLYKRMAIIYAENLRLSALRDTLLPKLMSGQIKL